MIVEAALGIAGGALIAAALAGFGCVRNWERAARIAALAGAVLAIIALIGLLVASPTAAPRSAVIATAMIAAGGALYSLRAGLSTQAPLCGEALLIGGLLLTGVALTDGHTTTAPPATTGWIALLASSLTLPAVDTAAREWHRARLRLTAAIAVWISLSIVLAAHVAVDLIQRGAWLGSTPGAAWAIAGWLTSSGSLLTRRGRPRAVLIAIAAFSVAFGALSA